MRKFLVVVDDSPEFDAALRFACRRARNTSGCVTLLRIISPSVFEHWAGVRSEIEREMRSEAESLLTRVAARVKDLSGRAAEIRIEFGEPKAAIRSAVAEDPDIKILVLGAGGQGRGPGPLVGSLARDGFGFAGRRLPVTVVPGDLSDAEIDDLA